MPTFEIVCLANSRKWQGRCVAGLRTDGEGWLRPVGSNAQGVLHSYHYTLPNNTEAQILDVLRIDCSRPHPKPHHPEDWVAMPVLWRLVSRSPDEERIDWLRARLASGPDLLGCRSDRVAHDALQSRPASCSLALVAPQSLEWIVKDGREGKRSARAAFTLDGAEYNLSLTDPVWENRLKALPLGTHPRRAARIADEDEIWLTISLGEPYTPAGDGPEFCYKLVAAVIVIPFVGKPTRETRRAKTPAGFQVAEGEAPNVRFSPDLSHCPDPFADTEAVQSVVIGESASASLPSASLRPSTPAPVAQETLSAIPGKAADAAVMPVGVPNAGNSPEPVSEPSAEASADPSAKSSWRDKIAKMRQTVPRAYMPWSREEDVLLRRLTLEGETAEDISAQMQRHPGSVRVRMEKLGLMEAAPASVSSSTNEAETLPKPKPSRAKRQAQAAELQPEHAQSEAGKSVIRVAVCGAAGRMGREVVRAIVEADGMRLVAAIDVTSLGIDAGELAGVGKTGVIVESQLESALERAHPDVLVDFTLPDSVKRNAVVALEHKVSPVIGTTGLSASDLSTLDALAKEQGIGAFIAPNFAIGAVLAMQFAAQAARYLPDVEIIELHHEKKLDSPSGTALLTAQKIAQARQEAEQTPQPLPLNPVEKAPGARGARSAVTGDIPVHSVRLPGFVAHQEVIFGGQGEILTIRHDSINRTSFMPGVVLAVRKARALNGLVIGLENLLT